MMAAGYSRIALQAFGAGSESLASVCQQDKLYAVPLQGGSTGALKRVGTVKGAPSSRPFSQAGHSKGGDPGSRTAENSCITEHSCSLA